MAEQAKEENKTNSEKDEKKSFYHKIEDAYYGFMEALQEKLHLPAINWFVEPLEKHGIPSMPVFILIVLAIICGLFVAFGGIAVAPQSTAFKVTVMADGKFVDGATILIEGDGFSFESVSKNGLASFTGIPKGKEFTVFVEKDGLKKEVTYTITNDKPVLKVILSAAKPVATDVAVKLFIQDQQGSPISEALVSIETGSNEDTGVTDTGGEYSFNAVSGASVKVVVSKDGFESATEGFIAEEGKTRNIILYSKAGGQTGFYVPFPGDGSEDPTGSGDSQYAKVVVNLDGTAEEVTGTVKLFDDATKTLILETSDLSQNMATFASIATGKKVFATASIDGYKADVSETKKVGKPKTYLTIKLTKEEHLDNCATNEETGAMECSNGNTTIGVGAEDCIVTHGSQTTECNRDNDGTIITTDENGTETSYSILFTVSVEDERARKVNGATVTLQDAKGKQLQQNLTKDGKVSFNVSFGDYLYFQVTAPKFLPFWSEKIDSAEQTNYSAQLTQANANNSAQLTVKLISPDQTPIENAVTSIRVNGHEWPLLTSVKSDSKGEAKFDSIPLNSTVEARAATKDGFEASGTIKMEEGINSITLVLTPPTVRLSLNVLSFVKKTQVSNADLTLYIPLEGNNRTAELNMTYNGSTAETTIYTRTPYVVTVKADNYYSTSESFIFEAETTDANKTVYLIDKTLDPNAILFYEGIYSESGNSADVSRLQLGENYVAKFALRLLESSDKTVFFAKIGKKKQALANRASFVKLPLEAADSVFLPTSGLHVTAGETESGAGCGKGETDLAIEGGLYRWLEVKAEKESYPESEAVTINIPILPLNETAGVDLQYYAYSVINNSKTIFSNPELNGETKPEKLASQRCTLNTTNETLKVAPIPFTQFICGNGACLTTTYSQKGADGTTVRGADGFSLRIPLQPQKEDALTIEYSVPYLFNPTDCLGEDLEVPTVRLSFEPTTTLLFEEFNGDTPFIPTSLPALENQICSSGDRNAFQAKTLQRPQAKNKIMGASTSLRYEVLRSEKSLAALSSTLWHGTEAEQTGQLEGINPEGYIFTFNEDNQLELYTTKDIERTEPQTEIKLYSSPLMPADAVKYFYDQTTLPASCTSAELIHEIEDVEPGSNTKNCFQVDNDKQLIKYDASKPNPFGYGICPAYEANPNKVKSAEVWLSSFPTCRPDLKTKTKITVEVTSNAPNAIKVWMTNKQIGKNAFGLTTCAEPVYIYVVVNNRQYGSFDNPFVVVESNAIDAKALATQGTAYYVTEKEQEDILFSTGNGNATIALETVEFNPAISNTILQNFVFHRRTKENPSFPYSALAGMAADGKTDKLLYSGASYKLPTATTYDKGCEKPSIGGVFISQVRPANGNSIPQPQTITATLKNTDYYSSTQDKLCYAPEETETKLCGDSYFTCGGCVLPLPMKFGTTLEPIEMNTNNIQCTDNGVITATSSGLLTPILLGLTPGEVPESDSCLSLRGPAGREGSDSSDLGCAGSGTVPSVEHGTLQQLDSILGPKQSTFFINKPSCIAWRYVKRGLSRIEKKTSWGWLIGNWAVYEFKNLLNGANQTNVICPQYATVAVGACDTSDPSGLLHFSGTCSAEEMKKQMEDTSRPPYTLYPEGTYQLNLGTDQIIVNSSIPLNNLVFKTKTAYKGFMGIDGGDYGRCAVVAGKETFGFMINECITTITNLSVCGG